MYFPVKFRVCAFTFELCKDIGALTFELWYTRNVVFEGVEVDRVDQDEANLIESRPFISWYCR